MSYLFLEKLEKEINFRKEYEIIDHIIYREYADYKTINMIISENFREWKDRKKLSIIWRIERSLKFTTSWNRIYWSNIILYLLWNDN